MLPSYVHTAHAPLLFLGKGNMSGSRRDKGVQFGVDVNVSRWVR